MRRKTCRHPPKIFDMAFFDATKNEHIKYFKKIAPRIKTGGMILTDNIISHKKELKNYLNLLQKSINWHSYIIYTDSGLLVSLKK